MAPSNLLNCLCGAPAPVRLPHPGGSPVRCLHCDTPLISPGRVATGRVERAFGAGLLAAVFCAGLWMILARTTASGAPVVVAAAGALVGLAARAASRARGGTIQAAALVAFLVFLVVGEVLLHRHALLPRLEAMHLNEGALDAKMRAELEVSHIQDLSLGDRVEHYLHIEATLALFASLAAGAWLVVMTTRAPQAVAAFLPPGAAGDADSDPEPETLDSAGTEFDLREEPEDLDLDLEAEPFDEPDPSWE